MTRIFLVSDHPARCSRWRALLATAPDLVVAGEACHGQALLAQLATKPADVVLLEVQTPLPKCLATLQCLHREFPAVRVLALAAPGHEGQVSQLFENGATGCVLQEANGEELLVAIRAVAAGRQFLCSELGVKLLQQLLTDEPATDYPKEEHQPLTRRETEILRLLADGLTTSEMAERLFTSKRTIETHRQNILEKTRTRNTAALIKLAMVRGLLD